VAWVPFLFYLLPPIIGTFQESKAEDHPLFLPTRYEFTQRGVSIKNTNNESQLKWEHFANWKTMAQCYVLFLTAGPMLAIPQLDVPTTQKPKLEALFRKHIDKRN
jgi:hypothetical protein